MAKDAGDYKKFREKFYKSNLRDIISDSRETVPCTLALFYLSNGDPVQAIIYAANFGRDSDTLGTMVGALAGAFKGVGSLKPEWVAKAEGSFGEKQVEGCCNCESDKKVSAQVKLANDIIEIINKRIMDQKESIKLYEELV